MKYILASGSPRRQWLMHEITDDFTVVTADVDERSVEENLKEQGGYANEVELATEMVSALSRLKAGAVYEKLGEPDDTLILGADTTVALSDEILGKPVDRDDAVRMLRKQSEEPQQVVTGITFILDGRVKTFTVSTLVVFNEYDETQEARIQAYCDTDEPYDKAGAYGIQGGGNSLVHHYEGEYNNIVGFPTECIKKELCSFLDDK